MSAIWTVFKKEVRDNIRDRRTVMSSLVWGPIFGPVLMVLLFSYMISQELEKAEEVLELPVVGAEQAPNLIGFLERNGAEIVAAPDDPEQAIRDEEVDLVVWIPDAFPDQWSRGEPAVVEILSDESRRDTRTPVNRAQSLIQAWGSQVGATRLLLRGVDPSIVRAVAVKNTDLSSAAARGAQVLAFLPYFVLITVFLGGMYLAIDATAGEKERQSLEPLLINPVPRSQIMWGKLLAAFAFATLTLVISLVAFRIAAPFLPSAELGFEINLDAQVLFWAFVATVPLALVASALQTIIAAFTNSYREAQTYLSFLMMVPILPSLWIMVSPIKEQLWMYAIPILSQNLVILDLIRGEAVSPQTMGLVVGTTLILGLVLGAFAGRLYHRSKLIFSGS